MPGGYRACSWEGGKTGHQDTHLAPAAGAERKPELPVGFSGSKDVGSSWVAGEMDRCQGGEAGGEPGLAGRQKQLNSK